MLVVKELNVVEWIAPSSEEGELNVVDSAVHTDIRLPLFSGVDDAVCCASSALSFSLLSCGIGLGDVASHANNGAGTRY